jgi:hypothetical protein
MKTNVPALIALSVFGLVASPLGPPRELGTRRTKT